MWSDYRPGGRNYRKTRIRKVQASTDKQGVPKDRTRWDGARNDLDVAV